MLRLPPLRSIALAAALALAGSSHAGTVWLCGLSDDLVRLVCVADDDAVPDPDRSAVAPTAQVKGTRFPLDPRGRWTVDLWSPPDEAEPVRLLARSTICYRSPDCEVLVHLPGIERGEVQRRPASLKRR
jgi:hypothetical protein